MSDLNSIETARPAFDAFTTLLGIMGDPTKYKASMEALQAKLEAIAEGERKLAADRAAHEAKMAADKAEIEAERRRASGMWREAQEAERKAAGLRERAEAYAKKIGFHEHPSSIPFGTGADGGMVVADEAPALPPPAAPAPEMVAEPFKAGRSGGRMVPRAQRYTRIRERI